MRRDRELPWPMIADICFRSAMPGPWVDVLSQCKLPNTSESLEEAGIHDLLFGLIVLNHPVNRITHPEAHGGEHPLFSYSNKGSG